MAPRIPVSAATATLLSFGLAVLLTGCGGAPAPVKTVVITAPASPAPTVVVTATPVAPPAAEAPPVENPAVPNASAPEVVEGPAYDIGPGPGAQGTTTDDGNGYLLTYSVASGDSFFDIAQRFDVPQQQLLRMNPSIPDFGETLYIGQIINLDWQAKR